MPSDICEYLARINCLRLIKLNFLGFKVYILKGREDLARAPYELSGNLIAAIS
jgi:hypothetical protein